MYLSIICLFVCMPIYLSILRQRRDWLWALCVAEDDLVIQTYQPPPLHCWNYRHEPEHLLGI